MNHVGFHPVCVYIYMRMHTCTREGQGENMRSGPRRQLVGIGMLMLARAREQSWADPSTTRRHMPRTIVGVGSGHRGTWGEGVYVCMYV